MSAEFPVFAGALPRCCSRRYLIKKLQGIQAMMANTASRRAAFDFAMTSRAGVQTFRPRQHGNRAITLEGGLVPYPRRVAKKTIFQTLRCHIIDSEFYCRSSFLRDIGDPKDAIQ